MSDRTQIDEIRNRLSIVDVVSDVVSLKRAGNTHKGLCPFHSEKTPSFNVSDDRGLFKCFGCGESGDIFAFVMKTQGIGFAEALRELADRAGVKLEERRKDSDKPGAREQILEMHASACKFFQEMLASANGLDARNYLLARGIDPPAIERFQIGLAPTGWDGLLRHFGKRYPREVILTSGLFRSKAETNGIYDLFRDRIIFPISDMMGRPIAFGARKYERPGAVEEKESPKYINSPESPIYTKGRNIYGIHLSKESIRRAETAVLVEGYTDVIAAHCGGFTNVVAALGTALTPEQVAILARFASRVILAYDPDSAGQNATDRGIDIALDAGLKVSVAALPGGLDPADALRAHGAPAFGKALDASVDFIEHRIDRHLKSAPTAVERGRAARELLKSLKRLSDPLVRAAVVRRVAERFGVPEASLLADRSPQVEEARPSPTIKKIAKLDAELALLRLMLDHPELAARASAMIGPSDFSKEVRGTLFSAIVDASAKKARLSGDLGGRLSGLALDLLAHVATAPSPEEFGAGGEGRSGESARLVDDYVRSMRLRKLDAQINDCTVNLRVPDITEQENKEIAQRLSALLREKNEMNKRGSRSGQA